MHHNTVAENPQRKVDLKLFIFLISETKCQIFRVFKWCAQLRSHSPKSLCSNCPLFPNLQLLYFDGILSLRKPRQRIRAYAARWSFAASQFKSCRSSCGPKWLKRKRIDAILTFLQHSFAADFSTGRTGVGDGAERGH